MLDYKNCIPIDTNRRNTKEMYPWLVTKTFQGCCFDVYSDRNGPTSPVTIGITKRFLNRKISSGCDDNDSWQAWYLEDFNITRANINKKLHSSSDGNPVLGGVPVNCSFEFDFKLT